MGTSRLCRPAPRVHGLQAYGQRRGKGKSHGKGGGGRKRQKNARDAHGFPMRSYDCSSEYHLAGSPECEKYQESLFAEAHDFAGMAVVDSDSPFSF